MYYRGRVGYEWLSSAMQALRDIEPHEVMYVLNSKVRRPVPAQGPYGHELITIWGRTAEDRALIVAVRQLSQWDWQILGVREMRTNEIALHESWEATRDEQ
jgi:hypothetical protein